MRGFTLIEILIALTIVGILFVGMAGAFMQFNRGNVLEREVRTVVSILDDARGRTLFSENDLQYGVHFESGQIVLFGGQTYSAIDPSNEAESLRGVTISSITLTGGASDVVFDRLTGATSVSGTTTVQLSSDTSQTKDIVILPGGIIEIAQ